MTVVLASVAFWAPVTYRLIGDNGQPEIIEGRARYQRLKTSERRLLDRRIRANRLTPDVRAGIRAQLDAPDCNFTARERAEVEADLAAALVRGYIAAQEAALTPPEQEKNSAAPSSTGS